MPKSTSPLKGNKGGASVPWDDTKVRGDVLGGPMVQHTTRGDDIVTRSPEPNTTSRTKSGLTTYPKNTKIAKDTSRLSPDLKADRFMDYARRNKADE